MDEYWLTNYLPSFIMLVFRFLPSEVKVHSFVMHIAAALSLFCPSLRPSLFLLSQIVLGLLYFNVRIQESHGFDQFITQPFAATSWFAELMPFGCSNNGASARFLFSELPKSSPLSLPCGWKNPPKK